MLVTSIITLFSRRRFISFVFSLWINAKSMFVPDQTPFNTMGVRKDTFVPEASSQSRSETR